MPRSKGCLSRRGRLVLPPTHSPHYQREQLH
jgi:hypothetical protein